MPTWSARPTRRLSSPSCSAFSARWFLSEPLLVSRVAGRGLFCAEIADIGQPVALHPGEAALVAKAAAKRQRDFALGRACARAALTGLGQGEAVLPIGPDGAPCWPTGTTGSITHTDGYAAALAGDSARFAGIGLDAERIGGVTGELFPRLFDADEQDWLRTQADQKTAATILFCAKEAAIKAWRPVTGRALSFRDIHIEVEGEGFRAAIADWESAVGRFAVQDGLVLASLCLAKP